MLPNPPGMLARVTDETHDLKADALRAQILGLVREYHQVAFPESQFVPGSSPIPVSGRVFDDDDLVKLVDSSLDFWLTTGRFAHEFERDFAKRMGLPPLPAGQLRILGQPRGPRHAHIANAR